MKALLFFAIFLAIILSNGMLATAVVEIPNPLGSGGGSIPALVDTIATWLLEIGLTISTIVVLWAAFLFMTSGGNAQKVTMARQTLWYAIIGLTVLLLAKGVTMFIENVLSGNFGGQSSGGFPGGSGAGGEPFGPPGTPSGPPGGGEGGGGTGGTPPGNPQGGEPIELYP